MGEVTITAEMVQEISPLKAATAERIAAYATLRFAGQRLTDARREVGVSDGTARHYEKLLPALRARANIPAPEPGEPFHQGWGERSSEGAHVRWHVRRGVSNPGCLFCQGGA